MPEGLEVEDIPSRRLELLAALRSSPVVRMTRHPWSQSSTLEGGPRPELVFSRAPGPLFITLESGLVIGASSQPSLISVTLWLASALDRTEAHLAVEAGDPMLSEPRFARLLGRRAASITVLVRQPENAKWEARPREVGVVVGFDGAREIILAHGLHDDSDDFAVLQRDDVEPSLWPRLHEVRVL